MDHYYQGKQYIIAPELSAAKVSLQSWLVEIQPSPKCVWSEAT